MDEAHEKLKEAVFFFSKIQEAVAADSIDHVKWYTSAFTSAARSVYQYVHEALQAKKSSKNSAQQWYEQFVKQRPVRFFKNYRNTNIHKKPSPGHSKDICVQLDTIPLAARIPESYPSTSDETAPDAPADGTPVAPAPPSPGATSTPRYYFICCDDSDLVALCKEYLDVTERFLDEFENNTFIDTCK